MKHDHINASNIPISGPKLSGSKNTPESVTCALPHNANLMDKIRTMAEPDDHYDEVPSLLRTVPSIPTYIDVPISHTDSSWNAYETMRGGIYGKFEPPMKIAEMEAGKVKDEVLDITARRRNEIRKPSRFNQHPMQIVLHHCHRHHLRQQARIRL